MSVLSGEKAKATPRATDGSLGKEKRSQAWKVHKGSHKMVLGRDVGLLEVASLSLCAFVGK